MSAPLETHLVLSPFGDAKLTVGKYRRAKDGQHMVRAGASVDVTQDFIRCLFQLAERVSFESFSSDTHRLTLTVTPIGPDVSNELAALGAATQTFVPAQGAPAKESEQCTDFYQELSQRCHAPRKLRG